MSGALATLISLKGIIKNTFVFLIMTLIIYSLNKKNEIFLKKTRGGSSCFTHSLLISIRKSSL